MTPDNDPESIYELTQRLLKKEEQTLDNVKIIIKTIKELNAHFEHLDVDEHAEVIYNRMVEDSKGSS